MTSLFRLMIQMSITASYVIAVVLVLRILMRRYPKKYSYYLWTAVLFRLCCPFSFRSALSIFNFSAKRGEEVIIDLTGVPVSPSLAEEGISGQFDLGSPMITEIVKEAVQETLIPQEPVGPELIVQQQPVIVPAAEQVNKISASEIAAVIWIIGIAALIMYAMISYLRLRKKLRFSVPLYGNIRQAEVESPFLMGLFKPIIYVPFEIDESALEMSIAHETYHLKRKDHWVRALSYCLLSIYWMNPLCWIAYFLMIKDMELSCDEHVLSGGKDLRAEYSNALLSLSTKRRSTIAAPVTFGGANVKERIKNAMRYKRAGKLASVIAALLCMLTLVSCAFNGKIPEIPEIPDYHDDVPNNENQRDEQEYDQIKMAGRIAGMAGATGTNERGYYSILNWPNEAMTTEEKENQILHGNLIYTDYETRQTIFLCNVPGCAHNSPDCTSFIWNTVRASTLFTSYSGDRLFYISYGSSTDGTKDVGKYTLTEMNLDGSERRTVCVLAANEEFSDTLNFIVSDRFVYAAIAMVEGEPGYEERTVTLERIWYDSGKRETIRQLNPTQNEAQYLFNVADERFLVLRCFSNENGKRIVSFEIIDQEGETIETVGPVDSKEYVNGDEQYGLKIEKNGDIATATLEFLDSGEKRIIHDIPYTSSNPAYCWGGYENKFIIQYGWMENGQDCEKALILDFAKETWEEFELRLETNRHYFVQPIAETGDEYLVLIDRKDGTIILNDTKGIPHTCKYPYRPTYALITKEDFWNSVPNYRIIEDKLG